VLLPFSGSENSFYQELDTLFLQELQHFIEDVSNAFNVFCN
jgi:hypothetical protein